MKSNKYLIILASALSLLTCKQEEKAATDLFSGLWRSQLHLDSNSTTLPFFLQVMREDSGVYMAAVMNGDERIFHDEVEVVDDSIFIRSPFFNSEIRAGITQNELHGFWFDHSRSGNYKIPFSAKYNLTNRFSFDAPLTSSLGGKWKTVFGPNTDYPDTAIAEFEHLENSELHGTFLTTTGDYRFLEGGYDGKTLKLSTFDGSHAFLFMAKNTNDTLHGTFYSGNHWKQDFISWRDEDYQLPDAYEALQFDSTADFSLSLPTIDGKSFELGSEMKNKPVIIQIMGTWCPNCLDESIFLTRNQERINSKGVELLTVVFERQELSELGEHLEKYRKNLEVEHPYLYGGNASKRLASEVFPQVSGIQSFPTTIFLSADHKIKAVHSGYSGPGTGIHFDVQSDRFWRNLDAIAIQ